MKILFISRATLFTVYGGDTVQMEQTAAQLRNIGVHVDIELCNNKNIDYGQYDLIHFFNIIRPADIMFHIDKSRVPFVVSPIYVEYNELARNERNSLIQRLLSLFGKHTREYLKVIARYVRNDEKIVSQDYFWRGHKQSIQRILSRCTHLFPNSQSEYLRLKRDFSKAGNYSIIPNAIDTSVFHITQEGLELKKDNTVLCIARFEPQKNQLNIIKALSGTDYRITFAGNIAPNHHAYYEACKKAAGDNVSFLDFANPESVAELYRRHKVHILASWFETTGLSSLEAVACGCNIVITKKGDTEAYFGTHAFYCDPASIRSIREAVDKAMVAEPDREFMQTVTEQYKWEVTARETLNVYRKILSLWK